jgi:Tol biopolymer transport system component
MAHGIQYVQATQFFELPSSSARGVPELRNKKCLNPNLTCGTRIWGRSVYLKQGPSGKVEEKSKVSSPILQGTVNLSTMGGIIMNKSILILVILSIILFYGCTQQIQVIPQEQPELISETVTITGAAGSLQQLTIKGPDEFPASLSPDFQWLLMDVVDSEGHKAIYKLNLKNQSKVIMTTKSSNSTGGVWVPDMSGIIFSTDRSGNNVIAQSLGVSGEVGARFITTPSLGNALFPDITSDGKDIAFSLFSSIDNNQINIIDSSGTNLRVFGPGWSPQFSPDNREICFVQKVGNDIHIFTMNAGNGANLTQLTSGNSQDLGPTWSPDGKKIAFSSNSSGKHRHLFIINSTGQNVIQLTDGNFDVRNSKWGKDGYIYFAANAGNNWDVWRLKLKSQ